MQEKQRELHKQVNKVEENTNGISTATNALKNRTDELAAKQEEILAQIIKLTASQQTPLGIGVTPKPTPGLEQAQDK